MKIRLTILTENNAPITEQVTEDVVKKAWQSVLDVICLMGMDPSEKATVEKVEIIG